MQLPRLDAQQRENSVRVQAERTLPVARIAYVAAAVLMVSFIGWDLLNDPAALSRTLPVRLACGVAFVALHVFARSSRGAERLNMLNALGALTAGFGISIVNGMLPRGFELGTAGLTMVVFAAVAVTPAWRQTLVGGGIVIAAANGVMLLTGQGLFTFAQNNGYMATSLGLASLLSYFLEQRHLKAFLLEAELEKRATIDVLTGVANRRHFTELSEREIDRARRAGSKLSLLMLDIDHFKRVNDTHGHAVGDEVLKALPRIVGPLLRKLDVLGRMGGEEFAILLVDTKAEGAEIVAERVRKGVQESEVRAMGLTLRFTVSIGCTEIHASERAEDLKAALERADEALYKAKNAGRNRIAVN